MTTATQENVKLFLRGVMRNPNKKVVRHLVYLVSQGRWGNIVELARALKFPAPLTIADLKAVIDPEGKLTDAVVFRNQLVANKTLRQKLALLSEGDWDGICAVAKGEGLDVGIDELKALVPDSFYKGAGAHPELGWQR